EPVHMAPVIPVHAINGALGIGTGYSTFIPNHHPLAVSTWLKRYISGQETGTLTPWYQGFTGEIEIIERAKAQGEVTGRSMVMSGRFHLNGNRIRVTELPMGVSTSSYLDFLKTLLEDGSITDFNDYSKHDTIDIEIIGMKEEPTLKSLKLTKSYGLNNMVLL